MLFIYSVLNYTVSSSDCVESNDDEWMNTELEILWKEAVVNWMKAQFRDLSKGTME